MVINIKSFEIRVKMILRVTLRVWIRSEGLGFGLVLHVKPFSCKSCKSDIMSVWQMETSGEGAKLYWC